MYEDNQTKKQIIEYTKIKINDRYRKKKNKRQIDRYIKKRMNTFSNTKEYLKLLIEVRQKDKQQNNTF